MRAADLARLEHEDFIDSMASPMGLPIYERLDYRTVVEYVGYVDRGSAGPEGGRG